LNYENAIYNAARVKPKNKKVELEIALDTKNANYSTTKGEQFALNIDGNSSAQQRYYKSNVMDKQLLISTNAATGNMSKHYCVGVVKSNQLHLTPMQNILQLKPSFEYFDIYEKKIKDVKEQQIDTGMI
jgi:DNA-directed RNA polymerase-3 subunit RPC5